LVISGGELREARDALVDEPRPTRVGSQALLVPCFDRAKYDRLRVLTTELKRVLRDGGAVTFFIRGRRVPDTAVQSVFRLV
jgi:hypothetical protein